MAACIGYRQECCDGTAAWHPRDPRYSRFASTEKDNANTWLFVTGTAEIGAAGKKPPTPIGPIFQTNLCR